MHESRKGLFVYQWSFEAGHNRYGNQYVFAPLRHRIDQRGTLEDLAERIVHQWKALHRAERIVYVRFNDGGSNE